VTINITKRLVENAEAVIEAYKEGERSPALIAEMYICLVRMLNILQTELETKDEIVFD
jgi:L-lactate utilization protein LutC